MVKISGTTITMTRGDTLEVPVIIKTADGEDFVPAAGDIIRFACKGRYRDPEPIIVREIPHDTMMLRLESADTKLLAARRRPYVYDIELTTPDGTVDTFIAQASLYITEEVY